MKYKVKIDNQVFNVEIQDLRTRPIVAIVNGQSVEVWPENDSSISTPVRPTVKPAHHPAEVNNRTNLSQATVSQLISTGCEVRAPIPGVIVSIAVQPGDEVDPGQELLVIEAMKMKNVIRSPRGGVIEKIKITQGQTVKHQDILLAYAE
jgi:biotin carboxyl carrier protein